MFRSLRDSQRQNLEYIAKSVGEQLNTLIDNKKLLLEKIGTSEVVTSYSKKHQEPVLFEYFNKFSSEFPVLAYVNENGLEELKLINGKNVAKLNDISETIIFEETTWHTNKTISLYSTSSPEPNGPYMEFGFCNQSYFDEFSGLIVGKVPVPVLSRGIQKFKFGQSGSACLVDSEGTVLSCRDESRILKKICFEGKDSEQVVSRIKGMKYGFDRVTISGVDSYLAYAPVQGHNWSVVAFLPYEEFMTRLDTLRNTVLLVGLAILFVSFALFSALDTCITRPVLELVEKTDLMAKGDLSQRIDIKSQDEIGILSGSFNRMAENLQKSTTSIFHLNREIEVRENVERALQESSTRLKAIFDTVQAGIVLVRTEDHIIVDVNEAAAKMIGMPKALIMGRVCHKYICPAEEGKCPISDLSLTVDNSERALLTADGKELQILKTVIPVTLGEKEYLLESFVDLTERKKAKEESRKTEEKYRTLFEGALDAIFVADVETGILVDCNSAGTKLVGMEKSELIGKSHQILHPPTEDDRDMSETFRQHLEERKDETLEEQVITKDGVIKDVAIKANLLEIGGRTVLQGIFRDITEGKKAESAMLHLNMELEMTIEKLRMMNQELADYAHVTAHDLKAPLRAIGSLAGILLKDYSDKLDEHGRDMLDTLVDRTVRLNNNVSCILNYSEIGRVEGNRNIINLNLVVKEIIGDLFVPENIEVAVLNELPAVAIDETRISQVFRNLLSNAIKYSDKSQGWIEIGCVEKDELWLFSVKDNGPGIDEKYFGKIFQIFQTLTRRDEKEATGIGLSIVKKIVELYGGRIWVESKLGEGTTFYFTLPKQEIGVKNGKFETNIVS
jgi:PAS domain S-box-containing protein